MRTAAALRPPPVMSERRRQCRDIAGSSQSGTLCHLQMIHLSSSFFGRSRRGQSDSSSPPAAVAHMRPSSTAPTFFFTFSSSRSLLSLPPHLVFEPSLIRADLERSSWAHGEPVLPALRPALFLARCSSSPFYRYSFRNEAPMRVSRSPRRPFALG